MNNLKSYLYNNFDTLKYGKKWNKKNKKIIMVIRILNIYV